MSYIPLSCFYIFLINCFYCLKSSFIAPFASIFSISFLSSVPNSEISTEVSLIFDPNIQLFLRILAKISNDGTPSSCLIAFLCRSFKILKILTRIQRIFPKINFTWIKSSNTHNECIILRNLHISSFFTKFPFRQPKICL